MAQALVFASGAIANAFKNLSIILSIFSTITYIVVGHLNNSYAFISLALLCGTIFLFVMLLDHMLDYYHDMWKVGELNRCRNKLLAGFLTIFAHGVLPRFLVFEPAMHNFIMTYCPLLTAVACCSVYHLTIQSFDKICYWQRRLDYIPYCLLFFLNIFQLEDALRLNPHSLQPGYYMINNMTCGIAAALSSIAAYDLMMGALILKADCINAKEFCYCLPLVTQVLKVDVVPDAAQKTVEGLDCKICDEKYSKTRVPRILSACGHTVCEECAHEIFLSKCEGVVYCPFCHAGFEVEDEKASELPCNFEIMDYIQKKGDF
ncbi:unnamed protein product [Caenorhabditis brenneri]